MSDSSRTTALPARRPALVLRALADLDQFIVKNGDGNFYDLDEHSYFLLEQLDGRASAEEVRAAYQARFTEPLTTEELAEFVASARERGFLEDDAQPRKDEEEWKDGRMEGWKTGAASSDLPTFHPSIHPTSQSSEPSGNSLLNFRVRLVNPDRLLTWLAPKVRFFWTRAFVLLATVCILAAVVVAWDRRADMVRSFVDALNWRTVVLAWVMIGVVTVLHEFAHGLTCKHFGGEVRDMGFLMLFFMPCFYANVSDAWLFPKRSQRLWVTFAGGFFELWLWSLAVFAWAMLQPGTLPCHAAFVIVTVCGVQTLFNFNPLLKLDGYYLLSDWAEIPNLQQRSADYGKARLRQLLWGAPPPEAEPRGRFLFGYGLASWLYSIGFLGVMLIGFVMFVGSSWGLTGLAAALLFAAWSLFGLFRGLSLGEFTMMLLKRHKRTAVWLLILAALAGVMCIPMEDWSGGDFQVRSALRAEVRAPVAGFLQEVFGEEGERVSPGAPVARLEIPDLASRQAQKSAEVREQEAKLRLLEAGPRLEERAEQRRRVERAEAWREQARRDLTRAGQVLEAELVRLDKQITQYHAELDAARDVFHRVKQLGRAGTEDQYREAERKQRVSEAQLEQARAEKDARRAKGTLEAETVLTHRDRELAEAQATLTLLEAGTRREELEAARAQLARLEEEARYLNQLQQRILVHSPVSGLITTPRLKEKVKGYVREGDVICVVEEPAALEVEIALAEQEVARVRPGQAVALKARALPFDTLTARVDRLAPAAGRGDVQSTVPVYCRIDNAADLRPGMTGYARIYTGRRSVGGVLLERVQRYLRTEFWW